MYSDENFNISPRYVERLPETDHGTWTDSAGDFEEVFVGMMSGAEAFFRIVLGLIGVVVLISAALIFVAFLAWCWSWTLPQPKHSTRSRYEHIQKDGRSPARPVGGERRGNPPAGRPTSTQAGAQEAPQHEMVLRPEGAPAPVFQWVCGGVKTFCRLDSNGTALQGFFVQNGEVVSSAIRPNLATPAAWGCGVRDSTELLCTIQVGRDRIIQSFVYDGKTVKEVHADE